MGTAIYPKHLLEGPIEAGTFAEFWGIDTDPTEIIGTGPFTIGEYTPGSDSCSSATPTTGWWTTLEGTCRISTGLCS